MGASAAIVTAAAAVAGGVQAADQARYVGHKAEDEARRQKELLEQMKKDNAPMPTMDSAQQLLARRRSIASTIARRGRESTIYSDDPLGG